jgi:long-chain acyl-CoA synthetase
MPDPAWQRFYPEGTRADFVPPRQHLSQMFIALVARHGDRIALDYRDHLISYNDLGRRAAQVANALRNRGIGNGDTVALYLPNSAFHPIFFFGILLAGARVMHLSPLDAFRDLVEKCADSEARLLVSLTASPLRIAAFRLLAEKAVPALVLCDEDAAFGPLPDATPASPFPLPKGAVTDGVFTEGMDEVLVATPGDVDAIALLQYTGGTTGRPKAAVHTHASLSTAVNSYLHWFASDPNARPEAVTLVVLPLFHIMALVAILLRRLNEGARLVIHQRFDVEQVLRAIENKRINGFSGVPTMWIAIANHPGVEKRNFSSLERIGSGGAPLPTEIYNRILAITGLGLRGGWGMTETGATGTNVPVILPKGKEGTVGLPLPGVTIDIVALDDPRRILSADETGEIRIRAPNVVKQYWNRPEETQAAFRDDCFLTGDIGRMDAEGFIYLVDRKKDLIISGGFNIYPQTIEDAIIQHPCVAEVLVIGVPDSYRVEAAKAFIVLKRGASQFTLDDLRAFLDDRLGRHEMPRQLAFRTELPRTPVGKYSRKLLRDQELQASVEST